MSETDALRALMEADRWIDRVGSQRNHLPEMAELATLEEELRELIKALQQAQDALEPVHTAYEDAKGEADRWASARKTSRRPSRRPPPMPANSPLFKMSSNTFANSSDAAKTENSNS